jgi:acyl transferase domain-containing protein
MMPSHEIAVLFPGQGVIDLAALRVYLDTSSETLLMLAEVDDATRPFGRPSVMRALGSGRRDGVSFDLMLFAASLAAYRRLERKGLVPRALVGHGFGEIAALVAAGALSIGAGAEIVARRATALASVKRRSAMAALQISLSNVETFLRILNAPGVSVAAENSPTESVIVGPPAGIAAAEDMSRLFRIPFQRLKAVSGPHQPGMEQVKESLVRELSHITVRAPDLPVYSPLRGRFYRSDDEIVACVAEQLAQPLRFASAVAQLLAGGITLFVECGPLRGLGATLCCETVADTTFAASPMGNCGDDDEAGAESAGRKIA